MPLTIRIESLRRAIHAREQGIKSLIQKEEEGVTQVAVLQLMRELRMSSIETNGQDGEPQTITYDSALLRTLCVPVDQQLFIAEMLATLQVEATKAQIACLTATITKGQEAVLLGDVQRKTRLFAQADPHIEALQSHIQRLRGQLAQSDQSILATGNERAIMFAQRAYGRLSEGEMGLTSVADRIAASANKAREQAAMSDLPDFAIDIAFQSGLIQGAKTNKNNFSTTGEEGFITDLAVKLAEQIKFV